MSNKTIIFNSKSKHYNELSNFYGGVEICFMKDRFRTLEIKNLLDSFENCDKETFIYYLKKFQPEKKWTQLQLNYWIYNNEPINGILAKLVGNCVKDGPTGKKRQKIIKEVLNISDIIINPPLNFEQKSELMLTCLRNKYKIPKYKDLLISTGNAVLHEKPMRGKGDDWTYPGNDLLGKLLMKIRDEINLKNN
uniref:NADAR domain-containing protein n=1 Tax=Mimiviridae sp. ChoanoV1 TaxID=2596887 RepID=A0A5B8IQR0_9VIRU|nr:hypothetical protein 6_26 [Mimiviridae sp. ChoanoV1]